MVFKQKFKVVNNSIIIILCLFLLVFSSCQDATTTSNTSGDTANSGANDDVNTNANTTNNSNVTPPNIPEEDIEEFTVQQFPINSDDIDDSLLGSTATFEVVDEQNTIIFDNNKWKINLLTKVNYNPIINLKDANLYMKVVDSSNTVLFEKYPVIGSNTIDVVTYLDNPYLNPELTFCFGFNEQFEPVPSTFVACKSIRYAAADFDISINKNSFGFYFKQNESNSTEVIYLKNTGSIGMLYHVFITNDENTDISYQKEFFLKPNKEEIIEITAFKDKTGSEDGFIYILPKGCSPSKSCAENAKVKTEFEINVN